MLGVCLRRLAEYDLQRQQWERRIGWYLVFQMNNQASKMTFREVIQDGKAAHPGHPAASAQDEDRPEQQPRPLGGDGADQPGQSHQAVVRRPGHAAPGRRDRPLHLPGRRCRWARTCPCAAAWPRCWSAATSSCPAGTCCRTCAPRGARRSGGRRGRRTQESGRGGSAYGQCAIIAESTRTAPQPSWSTNSSRNFIHAKPHHPARSSPSFFAGLLATVAFLNPRAVSTRPRRPERCSHYGFRAGGSLPSGRHRLHPPVPHPGPPAGPHHAADRLHGRQRHRRGLRQRRLAGPLRHQQQRGRPEPPVPQQPRRHVHRRGRRSWASPT